MVLLTVLSFSVSARDYSGMYTANDLQRASNTYSNNVRGMLMEDIAGYLTNSESATLHKVNLVQPRNRLVDPFEFSANPATRVILVPTFSIKFFDDLSIATAWFERFNCNKEAVFDYVAALDFNERELRSPLQELGVPDQAYKLDNYVDDVSQKILKSALAFLVLHELGHVHHRHSRYEDITAVQAQAQETEADQFAMDVLRRMRLPPLGMTVWFMAVSMRDPLVEGSPRQTHPLTSDRLQAIARELRINPDDFIEPANQGKMSTNDIRTLADNIDTIARNLSDPDLRSFVRERGRLATPALLANACEAQQHNQDWMDKFKGLLE
jgi:hypothetical protein